MLREFVMHLYEYEYDTFAQDTKVNVCLRMMIDYKEWQFAVGDTTAQDRRLREICAQLNMDE